MPRGRRSAADIPSGPATDLVALFHRLVRAGTLNNTSIAARAGMSRSFVGELLNGRKAPIPSTAARLAAVLGASPAEVTLARRLAEQLRDLRRYERARDGRDAERGPATDLWGICVAFVLALDTAHNALRECARGRHDGALSEAATFAVHESGLYAQRERMLLSGSPELVAAAEKVFLALVDIRTTIMGGAGLDASEYHAVYHPFAEAMWNFRGAVRAAFGQAPLTPELLMRADWSDRDQCRRYGP
ncbi:helix-turn-helix transcriptional regulator [Actinoplanes sp. DH11]|uniref:helix-turn-helix domain-containing protein n=1 Tax=Actinoplanes sp. DH11 TaxID=2857011 RepID=UPI001E2FF88A|nr:helix-turn-helix transcriptional regulator [Actinoplanes sp. DH11]